MGPLHPTAVVTKRCPQTTTQPASPAAGSSRPKAAPPSYRGRLRGGEGRTPRAVVRWSPPKGHRGSPAGQIWGPHGDFASGEQECRRPWASHGSQRWGKGQSWTWGVQQGLQGVTREGPGACTGVRASWAQGSGPGWARGSGPGWARGSGPAWARGSGLAWAQGVRAGWARGSGPAGHGGQGQPGHKDKGKGPE